VASEQDRPYVCAGRVVGHRERLQYFHLKNFFRLSFRLPIHAGVAVVHALKSGA
jgi:hypothetical protein